MSAPFRVVTAYENPRWPSGYHRDVAIVAIAPEALARRTGAALSTGEEPGLGRWCAVGLEMASGAPVEVIHYEGEPESEFSIRTDANADHARVREEVLAALALDAAAVLWAPPAGGD